MRFSRTTFDIRRLFGLIFYYPVAFLLKKSDGDSLDPLEYLTAVGKSPETSGIVFHDVEIQLIDEFIVVHTVREDAPDDAVHQRAALHEEKHPGDLLVVGYQAFNYFLVCHQSIKSF